MDALAVALVAVESASVELCVVGGVVAVDVGVFDNVGLRVEYAEVPDRVPDDIKARATEDAC